MNDLLNLYKKYGNCDYIGEEISQISHMTQAAMLAEKNNEPIEIVLACFLHDIGHLIQERELDMNGLGIKNHEKIGAQLLRSYLIPEPIPTLVENHVKTKKYKVYKYKDYYNKLSDASKKTLVLQGGMMTKEEATKFEQEEYFEWSNKVRDYDDLAKEVGVELKPLEYYEGILRNYILEKLRKKYKNK